jgi:tRNA-Thr(GGU) m(6)t(6)A37 methyltransferase TsaA
MEPISFPPIGIFRGERKYRYETPRQAVLAKDVEGVIELFPHRNFEQALADLSEFERIWVLYVFHLNANWKPLVNVPRHRTDKVGVFATRAPYRPNPIGLSCVRVLGVDGLSVRIAETDLLDGSPVLDLKPYLPYADSFPDAHSGWVLDPLADSFTVQETAGAAIRLDWVHEHAGINLRGFISVQLQQDPANRRRKRIALLSETGAGTPALYALAYRTWRIIYSIDPKAHIVTISSVRSGYSLDDLAAGAPDPHADKDIHRGFLSTFPFG